MAQLGEKIWFQKIEEEGIKSSRKRRIQGIFVGHQDRTRAIQYIAKSGGVRRIISNEHMPTGAQELAERLHVTDRTPVCSGNFLHEVCICAHPNGSMSHETSFLAATAVKMDGIPACQMWDCVLVNISHSTADGNLMRQGSARYSQFHFDNHMSLDIDSHVTSKIQDSSRSVMFYIWEDKLGRHSHDQKRTTKFKGRF